MSKHYKVLSIEAWREGSGWTWNQWYHKGGVPVEVMEWSKRKILKFMRDEGWLRDDSGGKCAIEDDGHNLVIVARGTREPLFAIVYGEDPIEA